MPTIVRLNQCRICVYSGDHAPPHFHAVGPDWTAVIEIASLELIKGEGPIGALREVVEWAQDPENLALLSSEWKRLNERD
jgi:hypothetical protein